MKDQLPDHLKFGYAHMMEMREIEKTLRATGLNGAELYFSCVKEYESRHKNDSSYRDRHRRWLATSSTPSPPDLLRQALEKIRDGHNDPRTLARETLRLIEQGEIDA